MDDLIIIMGPAGVGKSTISAALSHAQGWPMIEADDYHPIENKKKMASGKPLTDDDRVTWIDGLISVINTHKKPRIILACSALTPYVQERLNSETDRPCHWILPTLSRIALEERLNARKGHFMPASQIDSQLAALTPPKNAIEVSADQSVETICEAILRALGKHADQ